MEAELLRIEAKKSFRVAISPWIIPMMTSAAMLLAFFLGPLFPSLGSALKPYAKYNLSILLLINALHIDYRALLRGLLHQIPFLVFIIVINNVLLPLAAFLLFRWLWPEALSAVILLAGVSSGFSSASFAILLRVSPEPNLLITLGTSFLVPLSLPFLLYVLVDSTVEMDFLAMILQISWMIFVPMAVERILFFSLPALHSQLKTYTHSMVAWCLSVGAFILMISSEQLLRREATMLLHAGFWSVLLVLILYGVSLLCFARSPLNKQMIVLIASSVKNIGLASVLALDYFGNITLVIVIVYTVLWNFNIIFLRIWPLLRSSILSIFGRIASFPR